MIKIAKKCTRNMEGSGFTVHEVFMKEAEAEGGSEESKISNKKWKEQRWPEG